MTVLTAACTSGVEDLLNGGGIVDPDQILLDSSVEFVNRADPRVEDFDLSLELRPGGIYTQIGVDQPATVVFVPQTCAGLPEIRVRENAGRLDIQIVESEDEERCDADQLVYVVLDTAQNFNSVSVG